MIATLLAEGPGGDYGVHSEMFTNGLMRLHQAGKVTNRRKLIHEGYSVATFAAGTLDLYEWLDDNPDVRFLPVDQVNDPAIVAANKDMVTINGALLVDLTGQVAADTIGHTQYSGHRRPRGLRRDVGLPARGPGAGVPAVGVDGERGAAAPHRRRAARGHVGDHAAPPRRRRSSPSTARPSWPGLSVRERAHGARRHRPPRLPRRARARPPSATEPSVGQANKASARCGSRCTRRPTHEQADERSGERRTGRPGGASQVPKSTPGTAITRNSMMASQGSGSPL